MFSHFIVVETETHRRQMTVLVVAGDRALRRCCAFGLKHHQGCSTAGGQGCAGQMFLPCPGCRMASTPGGPLFRGWLLGRQEMATEALG